MESWRTSQRAIPRALALVGVMIAIGLNACQHEISGRYIGKFSDGVGWLQLVKTPDGHLTGELEMLNMTPSGTVDQSSVNLSGAVNGTDFMLSSTDIRLPALTLSGALSGNRLTLARGTDSVVFARSDLNEYQKEVNSLKARSQRILAANAAAAKAIEAQDAFSSEIQRVLRQMQEFNSGADLHLKRFPGAEETLHTITRKMAECVERERYWAGNPSAALKRSDLELEASRLSLGTNELNNQLQALRSSIENSAPGLERGITRLDQVCYHPPAMTRGQMAADNASCDQLRHAEGQFREKSSALARGLSHLDQTLLDERKAQEALLHTAQKLQ